MNKRLEGRRWGCYLSVDRRKFWQIEVHVSFDSDAPVYLNVVLGRLGGTFCFYPTESPA